jgi:hypothetical protein
LFLLPRTFARTFLQGWSRFLHSALRSRTSDQYMRRLARSPIRGVRRADLGRSVALASSPSVRMNAWAAGGAPPPTGRRASRQATLPYSLQAASERSPWVSWRGPGV